MNPDIILDFLISQSDENTFYYDDRTCSPPFIKEIILRGLQLCNQYPYPDTVEGGYGNGSHCFEWELNQFPMSYLQFWSNHGGGTSPSTGEGSYHLQDFRYETFYCSEEEGEEEYPEIYLEDSLLRGSYHLDN